MTDIHQLRAKTLAKAKETQRQRNATKKLGEDGRLQDTIEHTNGTYLKVYECDKFYIYRNDALGCYDMIDMRWKSFPGNEGFGQKAYDHSFSSLEMLLKKFPQVRREDIRI